MTFHLGKQQKKSLRVRPSEQGGWGVGVILFWVKHC